MKTVLDPQDWGQSAMTQEITDEEVARAQQIQPVLTVEKEPDYWSGGHFYEGTKSWINPTKVWALPIGTKLYADSNHTPPVPCRAQQTESELLTARKAMAADEWTYWEH